MEFLPHYIFLLPLRLLILYMEIFKSVSFFFIFFLVVVFDDMDAEEAGPDKRCIHVSKLLKADYGNSVLNFLFKDHCSLGLKFSFGHQSD